MSLKERVYSILIVSSTDTFTPAFSDLLPPSRYRLLHSVTNVSAAKRILAETTFDFVIINAPLTDDTGIRFSIDVCASRQTAVLLLIRQEQYDAIHDRVAEFGVFTLPKPLSKPSLLQALDWLESARERLRQLEKKNQSIEEKMAEIRLVNKAKWILISQLKMSEPDAHRYIEKQAMDRCISKRYIAEGIIKMYS